MLLSVPRLCGGRRFLGSRGPCTHSTDGSCRRAHSGEGGRVEVGASQTRGNDPGGERVAGTGRVDGGDRVDGERADAPLALGDDDAGHAAREQHGWGEGEQRLGHGEGVGALVEARQQAALVEVGQEQVDTPHGGGETVDPVVGDESGRPGVERDRHRSSARPADEGGHGVGVESVEK